MRASRPRYLSAVFVALATTFAASPAAAAEPSALGWFGSVAEIEVFGVATWRLVASLGLVALGLLLQGVIAERIVRPLQRIVEVTETELDDSLVDHTNRPVGWLVELVAVYAALAIIGFPDHVDRWIDLGTQTLATIVVAWALFRAIEVFAEYLDRYTHKTEADLDDQLVPVVRRILRFTLVVVAILLVIQQWGYDVTSLLAGLGIGGLAFALAARQMLSNWFGALMIFTDRPFEVGDWVSTTHGEGTVEQVGLRSTRIREYGDSLVTVPNSEMAGIPITNASKRSKRRISTELSLVRATTREQMEEVLDEVESLLDRHERVDDEGVRVHFSGFDDRGLTVTVSCFTATPDLAEKRDVRQELFLDMLGIVEEAGTSLAYPTRSVLLEGGDEATGKGHTEA